MKGVWMIVVVLILLGACGPKKSAVATDQPTIPEQNQDTIRIANEELEYEIIIMEVGFENWLVTQRPIWYYSQNLLENRNIFLVSEWNRRVTTPMRYDPNLYIQLINYEAHIDYGLEVNYLLYMYFKFFEQKYNQRLIGSLSNRY